MMLEYSTAETEKYHLVCRVSFYYLLLFYAHWCFVCMHVCVMMLGLLELKLQAVVSCHVGTGTRTWVL